MRYFDAVDTIGGAGPGPESGHAVLIKVKNAADLARSQGFLASVAQALLPATVETRVYSELVSQLRPSLKDKGVDADISVVDPAAWKPANGSHLWTDLAFAVGGAGAVALIFRLFFWRRK